MEKEYAQALWTAIQKGMKPDDAVRAMYERLQAAGRSALMPRIAKAFSRLALAKNERDTVTLTIAEAAHEHAARTSAAAAVSRFDLDEKGVAIRIDSSLIGGWRLEGRDELIDASYKKQLLAIYTSATQ